MPVHISVRESIRWLPNEASEPTNTLVLTSAENRYVDVRILKPRPNSDDAKDEDILSHRRIDWAFAGTSQTEKRQTPDGKAYTHSSWYHWLDSRQDGISDSGDMFPLPDGTTLEKGRMVNPDTGRETDYEEVWRDLKPTPTRDPNARVCIVMQLDDAIHEAKGMLVRVGQFVQGVVRVRGQLALEQWVWEGEKGGEGWRRCVRVGNLFVPCSAAMEEGRLKLGGEVRYGDFLWRVVELSAW